MEKILETLRDEFIDRLKKSEGSTPRDVHFSEIKNKVKVAIGMRRTGKTHFLFQTIRELLKDKISLSRILYLNFEDDRLLPASKEMLAELVDDFYQEQPENHELTCYLFFDEIQNVEDWPMVIRRLLDTKNVQLYLTGSSAKLLSKEISTSLRGRAMSAEVWPYSFSEYLNAKDITLPEKLSSQKNRDKGLQQLENYLQEGGFPEAVGLSTADRNRLLQDYLEIVIFRDIVERHNITNITLIHYILRFLINNTAGVLSTNKLFNDIKSQGLSVAKSTLYDYLSYIEDAFLAFTVPLFSDSIRKVYSNPKKIYLIDAGLVNACRTKNTKDWGHLFENLVYLDLRRQEKKIYYYLTRDRYEVDFFTIDLEGNKELIQVVWDVKDQETLKREERALKQAQEELDVPGRIITPESYVVDGL
jgi:predicted AAA+ superfamily ATPase